MTKLANMLATVAVAVGIAPAGGMASVQSRSLYRHPKIPLNDN